MYNKGIAYRREMRDKHIKRKKEICHRFTTHPLVKIGENKYRSDFSVSIPEEWYTVDGKYDKGKIHCGCPVCKPTKGFRPSAKKEMEDYIVSVELKEGLDET